VLRREISTIFTLKGVWSIWHVKTLRQGLGTRLTSAEHHLRLALVKCVIGLARDPWEGKTQFREKAKTNRGCALL
jgi:hypothetical protein